MNYDDHIQRHLARRAQEQQEQLAEEAKLLIALEISCQQAQSIVRDLIFPELENLQNSLRRHDLDCTVKIAKQKFQGIETEFEVEARVSGKKARLLFRAEPGIHAFAVTLRRNPDETPDLKALRYDEITPTLVQEYCARFMAVAFPA